MNLSADTYTVRVVLDFTLYLSDSLTVALLIWATWAIRSQLLICLERRSDEQMSKIPALHFSSYPWRSIFSCYSWRIIFFLSPLKLHFFLLPLKKYVSLLVGKVKAASRLLGSPGQSAAMERGYPSATFSYGKISAIKNYSIIAAVFLTLWQQQLKIFTVALTLVSFQYSLPENM